MDFLVTDVFAKSLKHLSKKYTSLKNDLENFKADFVTGKNIGVDLGNGFRKVRLTIASKNKGKRGGARIITFDLRLVADVVVLVDIYDKSEKESITETEYTKIITSFLTRNTNK